MIKLSLIFPLTTPITSSINVLGLNIDVGNVMPWTIPNILVTPVPPALTNTQMHAPLGPESTPTALLKPHPQSNFLSDFLLDPGGNPTSYSTSIFWQSEQPTLNIP
ncbi:hypothetical protein O181_000587 [Austropuccinia psidii MF-1]|uniref:Uncharacterized protein n=1 Tax=Austropuccinia psidii MF-1 TaxID=1389203 RepID=A0A9Q3GC75_9BASI|nr:hypothetical protein [Austropuccinia psidii MF-1]